MPKFKAEKSVHGAPVSPTLHDAKVHHFSCRKSEFSCIDRIPTSNDNYICWEFPANVSSNGLELTLKRETLIIAHRI